MKRFLSSCVLATILALPAAAAAIIDTFEIEKATVSLPVVFQTLDSHGMNTLATKTLKTNDLVNLALGRSLATKLDKSTEVLAFAADASTPGAGSALVVFNPATKTITATVWNFGNDFMLLSNEDFSKNSAFGSMVIVATATGDAAHNALHATTLEAAGTGKFGSLSSTAVIGPVSFTFTDANNVTTTINGIVLKGKAKGSGALGVIPPIM